MVDIADVDPRLVELLKRAADEWGALGVALAAAQLTDPEAVRRHLTPAFTVEDWEREADDPEAGHTFRIESVSRGSYAHIEEDGSVSPHTDAVWFEAEQPFRIEVRGWSLSAALAKAAQLPLPVWRLTP